MTDKKVLQLEAAVLARLTIFCLFNAPRTCSGLSINVLANHCSRLRDLDLWFWHNATVTESQVIAITKSNPMLQKFCLSTCCVLTDKVLQLLPTQCKSLADFRLLRQECCAGFSWAAIGSFFANATSIRHAALKWRVNFDRVFPHESSSNAWSFPFECSLNAFCTHKFDQMMKSVTGLTNLSLDLTDVEWSSQTFKDLATNSPLLMTLDLLCETTSLRATLETVLTRCTQLDELTLLCDRYREVDSAAVTDAFGPLMAIPHRMSVLSIYHKKMDTDMALKILIKSPLLSYFDVTFCGGVDETKLQEYAAANDRTTLMSRPVGIDLVERRTTWPK
jgi:hypothetical protein